MDEMDRMLEIRYLDQHLFSALPCNICYIMLRKKNVILTVPFVALIQPVSGFLALAPSERLYVTILNTLGYQVPMNSSRHKRFFDLGERIRVSRSSSPSTKIKSPSCKHFTKNS